jgi:hypothetical protein
MKIRLLSLLLLLSACASAPPPTSEDLPDEKDFGVPTELADKFSVKGDGPIAPAVPAPEPAPEKAKKGKKGKKSVSKAEKKAEPKKKESWPNRWSMTPFLHPGERYRFDITYFGATAGELVLEILTPKVVADRSVYHIRGTARTTSVFSLFYRMNDVAESFMDSEGLFSHKFTLKLDESLQQRDLLELYDQRKHTVHYWSKLDHKKKGKKLDQFEIKTGPFAQDGLSAFMYLRTLPLKIGDVYEFPVVNNGKLRTVRVAVVRKENLKTKIGEIPAIVVKPDVVLDGVLKSYGDSFVWLSDDPRRILLKIDAKIKVGSVIAYLREYSSGTPQP